MSCTQHKQNPEFIYLDKTGEVGTISLSPVSKRSLLLTGNSPSDDSSFTLSSLDSDKNETLLGRHAFKDDGELFFGLSAQLGQYDTLFLAGALWGDDLYPAFARLKATGPLDTSFGDAGTKVFRDLASNQGPQTKADAAQVMASSAPPTSTTQITLPGGGYLVASAETGYLFRLKDNGELDTTFGDGGKLKPVPEGAEDFELTNVTLRSDKVILVLGDAGLKGVLATYNMDGKPINGFGETGVVTIEHNDRVHLLNLSLSPDQNAVNVVGMTRVEGKRRAFLARLNAFDGNVDTGFNKGLPFYLELNDHETSFWQIATRLNQDQEERIYAVGGILDFSNTGYIAAAFDKHGLVKDEFSTGVEIGKKATLANSMLVTEDPPRLIVGGGVRMEESNDFQGFVAIHPLSQ
ncbi:hypothetical protein ACIPZG_16870 [Pseudomonas sp. NPDC089395]|uniref:hypothetical protein n=1 Tax=Pseudomonas sp. NPDC089395 TaxID=3364460 RepID=UPI003817E378